MSDCNCLQVWLAGFAIFAGFVYWRFKTAFKFWENRGIPGVKPTFPFGNIGGTFSGKESLGISMQKTYNEFKGKSPLASFYMFLSPRLVILDPEAIKQVLVKDFQYFHDRGVYHDEKNDPLSAHLFTIEGDRWKQLRNKLSPTFTSGKMKMMFNTMIESTDELKNYMNEIVAKDSTHEIKEILARFTTDIIGSCALGIQCNSLRNPDAEFRKIGLKMLTTSLPALFKRIFSVTCKPAARFLRLKIIDPEVSQFFLRAVGDTMKYREENNVKRNDFLQLLMQLKNDGRLEDDEGEMVEGKSTLTLNEAAAQALVFFFAGFETSSSTMSFCLYELAVNPDIQEKLRNEINKILDKNGGQLTYDAALQIDYLDRVIYETMRKYPTLPILNRECTKDYTFPKATTWIPRGTTVFIPVRGLHHDPDIYPEPDRFDPERFTEENKSKRHPYAYLPFGEGPRICIGMRFGMMQTRLGLITLLRNFKITRSDKTTVPLEIDPKQFMTASRGGIWLNFEKLV